MNIAQHLATTLKTLRQQRGWSLSRLAEETGVSKAMLGQVERNESSPTVATVENRHRSERAVLGVYRGR
jgi:transcriptional regulator with XRE-family HTH domain